MHILQLGLELIKEFVYLMKMMYGLFQFSLMLQFRKIT